MISYVIDEIPASDMEKTRRFLEKSAMASGIEGIFWVPVPDDLLTGIQKEHRTCRPHVFAVEIGRGWIKIEFFVRSLQGLRCSCPGYCTQSQRDYVIRYAHAMIDHLGLRT
jgi:hypothetical protein